MREPRPQWVAALRSLEGCASADIRYNVQVARWEFVLPGADGVMRSQFWGVFRDPSTGRPIKPDPVTGLYPFRDLDDAGMQEALANLERTYIANRHDSAGTTRRHVLRNYRFNKELLRDKYREAGNLFADMAADRGKRLRGATQISVPVTLTPRGA